MFSMTYKAHIKNGVAVLDDGVKLPENSQVLIQPLETPVPLGELLRDVAGQGKDLPADGSTQHDHYIYGTAKR
jgi:hypothetical protein